METTTVRLVNDTSICIAPEYLAEEFLRAEGFADIRYIEAPGIRQFDAFLRGELDFTNFVPAGGIKLIDAGAPIVVLAGIHVGCFELFAREGIRHIVDLKGKVIGLRATPAGVLTLMAAEAGLDPKKDLRWIADPAEKPKDLFIEGKIDAFLGFPPEPQELRAKQIGRVIFDTSVDRPWSQYFCCMLAGNREFVRRHPVATKRAMRAILKAADLCASAPARAARLLVDGGFTPRYDYALQTLKDVPYDKWRDYDAEDTIRFYALRMRETGFIKSSPQKIIAHGTDWRFLDELKRELKA